MHDSDDMEWAERLLSGADPSDPLGATLESMRQQLASTPPPTPAGPVTEFVSSALIAELTSPVPQTSPIPLKKKDRRIMSLSTLAGTAAGRVLIGASVAAASVGGAQASGVVDIPILPDVGDDAVVEVSSEVPDLSTSTTIEIDDSTDSPSTSVPSSTVPTSTVPTSTTVPQATTSTIAGSHVVTIAPQTFEVLDAGRVTIQGDSVNGLVVVDATANDGWNAEIEIDEPGEAGVNFRNGDDRVDFRAEIEDGALRVRFRDRRIERIEEVWFDEDGNPIAEPASDSDDDGSDDSDSDDDDSDDSDDSDDDDSDDSDSDDSDDDDSDSDDSDSDDSDSDDSDDSDSDDSDSDDSDSDDDDDDDSDDDDDDSDDDSSGSGS